MRCIVYYNRGPFFGSMDFGVSGRDDPKIAERCKGLEIVAIEFI